MKTKTCMLTIYLQQGPIKYDIIYFLEYVE